MIIYTPKTEMPAPYDEYIRQRAENISAALRPVVGEAAVQLCSRAILPEEKYFSQDLTAITYGCVVQQAQDGLKSVLYEQDTALGMVAYDRQAAREYAMYHFAKGNRVRFKDPRESDGAGQTTIASVYELDQACDTFAQLTNVGAVLMPHLARIEGRFSVGTVRLGSLWRL